MKREGHRADPGSHAGASLAAPRRAGSRRVADRNACAHLRCPSRECCSTGRRRPGAGAGAFAPSGPCAGPPDLGERPQERGRRPPDSGRVTHCADCPRGSERPVVGQSPDGAAALRRRRRPRDLCQPIHRPFEAHNAAVSGASRCRAGPFAGFASSASLSSLDRPARSGRATLANPGSPRRTRRARSTRDRIGYLRRIDGRRRHYHHPRSSHPHGRSAGAPGQYFHPARCSGRPLLLTRLVLHSPASRSRLAQIGSSARTRADDRVADIRTVGQRNHHEALDETRPSGLAASRWNLAGRGWNRLSSGPLTEYRYGRRYQRRTCDHRAR
ncbi:MAG: hypothetical protein QOH56_1476 [Pseudonocardiales bacterium]|jgi:hypothetical protein|nr:hypothetical protein [Pseudonocardiales bacterium]